MTAVNAGTAQAAREDNSSGSEQRFTGFVTQQSLVRDAETEQSDADQMLRICEAGYQPRDTRLTANKII